MSDRKEADTQPLNVMTGEERDLAVCGLDEANRILAEVLTVIGSDARCSHNHLLLRLIMREITRASAWTAQLPAVHDTLSDFEAALGRNDA